MNLKTIKKFLKATLRDAQYNWNHLAHQHDDIKEVKFSELRKYCHMLDKALNNPEFKKGHSKPIIEKAKKYISELEVFFMSDPAFIWCKKIVERFDAAQVSGNPELLQKKVVSYTTSQKNAIESFITARVSVRNFMQKKIPLDVIDNIVKIAVDAPNGCCRQSTRFYIVQDEEKMRMIMPNIAGLTNFTNVACLACVVAEGNFYEIIDKNLQYVDASLAAENFILAASVYGVYGTMCNFFHASKHDVWNVKKTLGIKVSENVVLFIALGYPIAIPEKPQRRKTSNYYKLV